MILLAVLVVIAVIIVIVAAASGTRQLRLGPPQPPLLQPSRSKRFEKRLAPPAATHFKKRVPPQPPVTMDVRRKPGREGGTVKPKKVHVDFSRPCRVTGRAILECGCQICRELRKKYSV